jgi:hypothetical protein
MLASYLNPASPLNLTPEIVDRLFNAYQTGLPRKIYFVDEVELWKIRWALVDDKPETTLHATNQFMYSHYFSCCIGSDQIHVIFNYGVMLFTCFENGPR